MYFNSYRFGANLGFTTLERVPLLATSPAISSASPSLDSKSTWQQCFSSPLQYHSSVTQVAKSSQRFFRFRTLVSVESECTNSTDEFQLECNVFTRNVRVSHFWIPLFYFILDPLDMHIMNPINFNDDISFWFLKANINLLPDYFLKFKKNIKNSNCDKKIFKKIKENMLIFKSWFRSTVGQ